MKTPSEREIQKAFHALSGSFITEKLWAEYAQWSRFDPRLAEAWIDSLSRHWQSINPLAFREMNLKSNTPAVLGLLLDQCEGYKISKSERTTFRNWKRLILSGVQKAKGELFLIGVHPFASPSQLNEFEFASKIYSRWGFGGKDIFVNKFSLLQAKVQKSILDLEKRFEILKGLMREKKRFTVNDYLLACENRISRRVAQKDLAAHRGLKLRGDTRARFYMVNSS